MFSKTFLKTRSLAETLGVLRVCCIDFPASGGRMLPVRLLSRAVHPPCLGP